MTIREDWNWDLSTGTVTALAANGITSIDGLNGLERRRVAKFYGMGKKRLVELDRFFIEKGLKWAEPPAKLCRVCGQTLPSAETKGT